MLTSSSGNNASQSENRAEAVDMARDVLTMAAQGGALARLCRCLEDCSRTPKAPGMLQAPTTYVLPTAQSKLILGVKEVLQQLDKVLKVSPIGANRGCKSEGRCHLRIEKPSCERRRAVSVVSSAIVSLGRSFLFQAAVSATRA